MKINKKIFIPIIALMLTVCACSKAPNNDVSIYDLQTAMLAADESFPEMITVNSNADNAEELLAYVSDMDYDKVDAYFIAYSSDGELADEVVVIRVKDSSDTEKAVSSLKDHQTHRVNLYRNYGPDQTKRAEDALVFSNGNYAVLIISDNDSAVKGAFENGIL